MTDEQSDLYDVSAYYKMTDCRNTVLITRCPFVPPTEPRAIKINDDFYYVPSHKELRPYRKRSMTKGDNLDSVRKSFNRLKAVINCNYDSPLNVRYITLTYAENMQDNKRISNDLRYFFRNMKRRYGEFEYIYTKEKQARGAWHIHMILFFDREAPYMPNTKDNHPIRDAWGHGFVNVQGFEGDINNLGNYLCAYLTDDKATSKKGARLQNYESGIRLYNCSKGIKRPTISAITHYDYLDFVSDSENTLISETESYIVDSDMKPRKVRTGLYAVI